MSMDNIRDLQVFNPSKERLRKIDPHQAFKTKTPKRFLEIEKKLRAKYPKEILI